MPSSDLPTPPTKGHRGWRFKAGLLIGSGVITLLLGEAAVRVYAHFSFPKLMVLDEALGWRHAPGLSKIFVNEDGDHSLTVQNEFTNRGPAYPHQRAPGKRRVLVLGDSFTEGVHVAEEQLFTAVLEDNADDLEVINTGVGGWGTIQQYLYYREEGVEFQADQVLLMFYENDLDDNVLPYSPGIGDRPYAKVEEGRVNLIEDCDDDSYLEFIAPVPGRAFLFANSYLFYAFNDRLWQPPRMQGLLDIERQDREAIADDDKYAVFLFVLEKLNRVVTEGGARLDLVLIPSRLSMEAGASERHERILAECAKLEISAQSLLPILMNAHANGQQPYYKEDIHWNKLGHSIAGQALGQVVEAAR